MAEKQPKKNPAAVALGRKGGKAKGRKGLAAMSKERADEIRRLRWAKKRATDAEGKKSKRPK